MSVRSSLRALSPRTSVGGKIVAITAAVTVVGNVIAAGLTLVGMYLFTRDTMTAELETQATIVASNAEAALAFDDPADAQRLLGPLSLLPGVRWACLRRPDGTCLATWAAPGERPPPAPGALRAGARITGDRIDVVAPVRVGALEAGDVVIRSDLSRLERVLRTGLLGSAASAGAAVLLSVVLAIWMQRRVTGPVRRLADLARRVEAEDDLSLRAARETDDEVGALADTLNGLLDAVERGSQQLRQSERSFREILGGIREGIFVHSAEDGRVLEVNDAALALYGMAREELLAAEVGQLSSGEPSFDTREARRRIALAAAGDPQVFLWRSRRRSGELFWAEVALVRAEIRGARRVLAVVRDVSERVALEEQVRAAQRTEAIGTLAGGIAHDFNNILQAVVGAADVALSLPPGDPETRECLQTVQDAGRRAVGLARQLLALSRHEAPETRVFQPRKLVQEAARLLRSSLPTTIAIDVAIGPHGNVRGDPNQFHQVLVNLGVNAHHAMEARGGTLSLRLDEQEVTAADAPALGIQPGPCVRLVVADTGTGIAPDLLPRIFEPYFSTKPKGKGTGLGLAVVRSIVRNMGGAIRVRSAVGEGSTFEVLVPEVPAPPADEEVGAALPRGSGRVLVVDDEAPLTRVCQRMLSRLGFEVEVETDPARALERVRSDPAGFRLVISDGTMPGMTGVELTERLRALRPDLPVVVATGFADAGTAERARAAGARAFVAKPFGLHDLARAVEEALRPAAGAAPRAGREPSPPGDGEPPPGVG